MILNRRYNKSVHFKHSTKRKINFIIRIVLSNASIIKSENTNQYYYCLILFLVCSLNIQKWFCRILNWILNTVSDLQVMSQLLDLIIIFIMEQILTLCEEWLTDSLLNNEYQCKKINRNYLFLITKKVQNVLVVKVNIKTVVN